MEKSKSPREPVPSPDRDDVHVVANRCPFCHDPVAVDDAATLVCQRCLARHHAPCWSEGGACSACGATERLMPATTERARAVRALAVVAAIVVAVSLIFLTLLFTTPRDTGLESFTIDARYYVDAQRETPARFQVPNDVTLLVSDGQRTGAIVFDAQTIAPGGATFRWVVRDGPGLLDPSDPAVRSSTGEAVREGDDLHVRFGTFDLVWSPGTSGRGWVHATPTTRLRLTAQPLRGVDPTTHTYLDDAGREWPAR